MDSASGTQEASGSSNSAPQEASHVNQAVGQPQFCERVVVSCADAVLPCVGEHVSSSAIAVPQAPAGNGAEVVQGGHVATEAE